MVVLGGGGGAAGVAGRVEGHLGAVGELGADRIVLGQVALAAGVALCLQSEDVALRGWIVVVREEAGRLSDVSRSTMGTYSSTG